jgi:hypothetical protein
MAMYRIIQGGAATIPVRLLNYQADGQVGDPVNLTGAAAILCCFEKQDGTELQLGIGTGITVDNALLGKISIAITAAQSALLAVTDHETLELAITLVAGQDPIKIQVTDAYTVVASRC